MVPDNALALAIGGILAGILAGFLGIGGGTVLVPLMLNFGIAPIQAVGTSNLSIVLTAISGSIQNWRMGQLRLDRIFYLGLPALATAQVGVLLAELVPSFFLLLAFGCLMLLNVYLVEVRKQVTIQAKQREAESIGFSAEDHPEVEVIHVDQELDQETATDRYERQPRQLNPVVARILTGGTAGFLAGFFGIGGGVIMVPLQIILLGETIKAAIQTSLGVIVMTSLAALVGHTVAGNVLVVEGVILGTGGFCGAQLSTRILPKLPDRTVSLLFRGFLAILAIYIFWRAWLEYSGSQVEEPVWPIADP